MNLKTIYKLLSLLFLVIVLISCESQKYISIVVLNKQTNEPMDSVFVKVMAGKGGDFTKSEDEGYTNASGKYETYIMIGCSGGCYDIKINYSKKGFYTIETMNQIKDTVYLIPENTTTNDKSNPIGSGNHGSIPFSDLPPLVINSAKFVDFFEDLNKKGLDSVKNWMQKELIRGRKIVKDNLEGIICDFALRNLDQYNNPIDSYIVSYQNGLDYDNGCFISSVTSSPYTENPVQLEIRTSSSTAITNKVTDE